MKSHQFNLVFRAGLPLLMVTGTAAAALANEMASDPLTAGEVFNHARTNYAAMSSYSDQGQVVRTSDGITTITPFTTQLARPEFYLVKWQPNSGSSSFAADAGAQAVWSIGAGHFLETGYGAQSEDILRIALKESACYSGGASENIPVIFFNLESDNELDYSTYDEQQEPDDNVGSIDCYVFTRQSGGVTRTLWIGKRDFLIHQIRTVISAQEMLATAEKITGGRPRPEAFSHQLTVTEIHTHIEVNRPFSRSEFIPSIIQFAPDYQGDN
jgi:outer membrane lipoprotein-sorting protein